MEQGEWMTGWMNEQVKGEIEDLRRKFGFEQKEAIAYWHLRRAEWLRGEMDLEDRQQKRESEKEEDDALGYHEWLGKTISSAADSQARAAEKYGQHFGALYRDLGTRVLKRDYQEGWGDPFSDVPEEIMKTLRADTEVESEE